MAITFEQFKIVLTDVDARRQIGLNMNDDEAVLLQRNEARAFAFFETWNQNGAAATSSVSTQHVIATGTTWSGPAITGFVLSLIAGLSPIAHANGATLIVGVVALTLSWASIAVTRNGAKHGHGLAIAGTVISGLAVLGVLASALITSIHL